MPTRAWPEAKAEFANMFDERFVTNVRMPMQRNDRPLLSWPIYIISLKHSSERRSACAREMAKHGLSFEFFDAIDGATLSTERVNTGDGLDAEVRPFKRPLAKNEIGCYLSHYSLWRKIGDSECGGAFIFEDDFECDEALDDLLHEIERLSLRNTMVKLFSHKKNVGVEIATVLKSSKIIWPNRPSGFMVGYALDKWAAKRLCGNGPRFTRPVDIDVKFWWRFGIAYLAVEPSPLKLHKQALDSEIAAQRIEISKLNANKATRFMRNVKYQLNYMYERRNAVSLKKKMTEELIRSIANEQK